MKSSFYNGDTTYTATNDPTVTTPDPNPPVLAPSSFYKNEGGVYAGISLADTSVADIAADAFAAAQSANQALGDANRASAWSFVAQRTKAVLASLAAYSLQASSSAAQASMWAKRAKAEAQAVSTSLTARLAGFVASAAQYTKQSRAAAMQAQSAVMGAVAQVQSFTRRARGYADQASMSMNAAKGASAEAWGFYKRALLQAKAAAASAALLTDDQISMKAQVFN